jgi:hypothetical protein
MASVIDTRRGHAWKMFLSSVSLSPSNAFRIGVASAAPTANAARAMTTVTGFGPAGYIWARGDWRRDSPSLTLGLVSRHHKLW